MDECGNTFFSTGEAGSNSSIVGSVDCNKTASVVASAPLQRKRKRSREQSRQSPLPSDVHPLGEKEAAQGPYCQNVPVRWSSKSILSNRQILRRKIEEKKPQPPPEGHFDVLRKAADPSTNSTENNSSYSSPYGAFWDQFCYKPDHRSNRNPAPTTARRPARLPPRGCYSVVSPQLAANETPKAATTPVLSASVFLSQEVVKVKDQKPNITDMKKKRKPVLRKAADPSTNSTENNSNYSSPYGPFWDQFCYKPDQRPNRNPVPTTTRRPARLPPRGCYSVVPSQLAVNETPKATKTPVLSASVSHSQEVVQVKDQKPDITDMKKKKKKKRKRKQVVRKAADPSTNSTENNFNYSSPYGAFWDQFGYKPDHRPNRNPVHTTARRPARLPPRGCYSVVPSQLAANETPKATKTPVLSALVSLSQEVVQVKDRKPDITDTKKRKPVLRTAEKKSDVYRRVPLDQLVIPPCSPHKLLQESYASDPWKVIVICMLLNLTQGKQVRKKVEGFFKRYPDPQTACCANPVKMAEYLAPLGLQQVKTERIQRFSKDYVDKEWTYVTELCGVGKYAADAYAIFCAGRATEVVPQDHKLVDYWKYVCFELPSIQSGNSTEGNMVSLEETRMDERKATRAL